MKLIQNMLYNFIVGGKKIMKETFELIWQRMVDNSSSEFHTKLEKSFSYKIEDNCFIPLRLEKVPQNITKELVEDAYNQWPVSGPGDFTSKILAPSYLWGVFNDERIIKKDK